VEVLEGELQVAMEQLMEEWVDKALAIKKTILMELAPLATEARQGVAPLLVEMVPLMEMEAAVAVPLAEKQEELAHSQVVAVVAVGQH
jgi:hypothetical protein